MSAYILLIEKLDGIVELATGRDGRYLTAIGENNYLLREVGDRLLEQKVILSYQLAILSAAPKTLADIDMLS